MTTKLKFVEAACVTFNCTFNVVLTAVSGHPSVHPELATQIKELADKNCNATTAEWQAFTKQVSDQPMANKILWALTTGAEIEVVK